jgi:hypothetical protein
MAEEGPWERYGRDKLPQGWAYPLGRDEVEAALVSAGVRLGSLSFSRTDLNKLADLYVLRVYWASDAGAKYFGSRDPNSSPLRVGEHLASRRSRSEALLAVQIRFRR